MFQVIHGSEAHARGWTEKNGDEPKKGMWYWQPCCMSDTKVLFSRAHLTDNSARNEAIYYIEFIEELEKRSSILREKREIQESAAKKLEAARRDTLSASARLWEYSHYFCCLLDDEQSHDGVPRLVICD